MNTLKRINLEQAARAVVVFMSADVPVAIWGPPGIGKSSMLSQLGQSLDMRICDVRVSDKEPSDLGGIPFPVTDANGKSKLMYLVTELLPFDTDEKVIVLFDEADRADIGVQNVLLQLTLDRRINGHKLSPHARIVVAGNASTDIGTTPFSRAAANRMGHLNIETGSPGAYASWETYAERVGVSAELRGFAKYRSQVWSSDESGAAIEEMAYPTPRTFDYADKIIRICETDLAALKTRDILPAMVAGCVGVGAATEFLAFRDLLASCPTPEEIVSDPEHARIPEEPGVCYALTISLVDYCKHHIGDVGAIAHYGLRWPEEPAAFLFRRLLQKTPQIAATKPYIEWNNKRLKALPTEEVERELIYPILEALNGTLLPDNDKWINRIQVPNSNSKRPSILSQSRAQKTWFCSCPHWLDKHECDHTRAALEATNNQITISTGEAI